MINIHATHAPYAAYELHHFMTQVVDEPVLRESSSGADRDFWLVVKPGQSHEVIIEHDKTATTISGRTAASLLHGVYCFLERLGYVFSVRGPIAPPDPVHWPAPFSFKHTPTLAVRGIRQHINFPMDISCLPLAAALEYVRNLARLKLNFLAFHLYPNQGWLRLDYKGYKVGVDPQTTLYYSERHDLCQDPTVRAQSVNRETWFIPEFESHYRAADQHKMLRGWLREVMRCAKTCGMTVAASVEAQTPSSDDKLAAIGEPVGPELYARVTVELALAALEQYPDIDQIEIITQENENFCPTVTSLKDAADGLRKEFAINEADWPAPVQADASEARTAGTLVSSARTLQVAIRAFELMRQDERAGKLLAQRTPVCAIYSTLEQSLPYLGAVVRRLLPPGMKYAMLASYSSRCTASSMAAVNLPPDVLPRTRIYAWCEFDGLMYLLQNECEGVQRCIRLATRDGAGHTAELACNHWRTAENELAINYLADGAFGGKSPREFYARFLGSLLGHDAAPKIAKAMADLDEATAFAVKHLFNLGFCSLGCWNLRGAAWSLEDIAKYRDMLAGVADEIVAEVPKVARAEGLERCALWVSRLEASQIHCDVVSHLRTIHDMVDWETGKLPDDKRDLFCRHAHAARTLAGNYVTACAKVLPDRMSIGALTSYDHVMYGLLDKTLAEFIGCDAPAIEQRISDGPPPPLR